MVVDFNRKS